MRRTKTEKGITLIALVITIVLLLLVAAVAVYSIKEYGILGKSEDKLKDYNEAVKNEKNDMQEYDNIFEDKVEYLVQLYKEGKLKIGDYVNYKPSKNETGYNPATRGKIQKNERVDVDKTVKSEVIEQEELNWRVFGYNEKDDTLLLISSAPTKKTVHFSGNDNTMYGWDTILNDICSTLYGNAEIKGATVGNFYYQNDFKRERAYYDENNNQLQMEMATGADIKYCYASSDSIVSWNTTRMDINYVIVVDGSASSAGQTVPIYDYNVEKGAELRLCLRPVVIIDNTVTTKEVPITKTNPFEKWTTPEDQFYSTADIT